MLKQGLFFVLGSVFGAMLFYFLPTEDSSYVVNKQSVQQQVLQPQLNATKKAEARVSVTESSDTITVEKIEEVDITTADPDDIYLSDAEIAINTSIDEAAINDELERLGMGTSSRVCRASL